MIELAFGTRVAVVAPVRRRDEVPVALQRLGLARPRPTLVLVGGASGLSDRQRELAVPVIEAVVSAVAALDGAVVDGGTDSGVMRLMGEEVARTGARFPLVGVAPAARVALPGQHEASGMASLEPHHTHFVLVPGRTWGDESEWISLVATVIAGSSPSATVLVDGGETAWRDVESSVDARRPVIVVDGSGRTADAIAAARDRSRAADRAARLVASGLVEAVALGGGAGQISEAVRARLGQE